MLTSSRPVHLVTDHRQRKQNPDRAPSIPAFRGHQVARRDTRATARYAWQPGILTGGFSGPVHTGQVRPRGVLIYDADCGFCVRSLGWAIKLGITCEHQPWQRSDLPSLGLSEADARAAAWYAVDGRCWRGHEAIGQSLATSRYLPVRWVGRLLGTRTVRPLARPAYQWIANHRHQLPGGNATCRLD
ncbi:MAG: thiol-disulfide oxidoreductase DCC family protein [Nocardioides sp.]